MLILLSEFWASFDNAATTTIATSSACTTTYTTSSLIILVQPFTSPKPVPDSNELTRKRQRESFGSSLDVSCDRMWAEFQCFWVS